MKFLTAVLVTATALLSQSLAAQDFPNKAVRMIVPFPPGGPLDIVGRLVSQGLSDHWKQPVVVENRPGGTLGPDFVAKSAPDGYTMLIISSTPLVTLPHMQKVPYDVLKDLTGVTQTSLLTYALVAGTDSGISSFQDLIDRAKKEPNKINYASAGNGSGQHLFMELIRAAAGIELTHVPYKGAAPALQSVMSGQVPIMLDVTVAAQNIIRAGKARAILVTGAKSLEQFPGAAIFESLYPGRGIPTWHGIFVQGATPAALTSKLATDIRFVLQNSTTSDRFRQMGFEVSGLSGEEFNRVVRSDHARWGEIIQKNNLRAD
jgi:tripartite-type tricarboxylate transporter receptor subunit TctC